MFVLVQSLALAISDLGSQITDPVSRILKPES